MVRGLRIHSYCTATPQGGVYCSRIGCAQAYTHTCTFVRILIFAKGIKNQRGAVLHISFHNMILCVCVCVCVRRQRTEDLIHQND